MVAGLTIVASWCLVWLDLPDEAICGNAGSNISEGGAEGAMFLFIARQENST
jgi:hypothetical protein